MEGSDFPAMVMMDVGCQGDDIVTMGREGSIAYWFENCEFILQEERWGTEGYISQHDRYKMLRFFSCLFWTDITHWFQDVCSVEASTEFFYTFCQAMACKINTNH